MNRSEFLSEFGRLAREFEERVASDAEFAADARARLEFFYQRTPYYDAEYRVYPVMRELD